MPEPFVRNLPVVNTRLCIPKDDPRLHKGNHHDHLNYITEINAPYISVINSVLLHFGDLSMAYDADIVELISRLQNPTKLMFREPSGGTFVSAIRVSLKASNGIVVATLLVYRSNARVLTMLVERYGVSIDPFDFTVMWTDVESNSLTRFTNLITSEEQELLRRIRTYCAGLLE